jgi:hypothetical protein
VTCAGNTESLKMNVLQKKIKLAQLQRALTHQYDFLVKMLIFVIYRCLGSMLWVLPNMLPISTQNT